MHRYFNYIIAYAFISSYLLIKFTFDMHLDFHAKLLRLFPSFLFSILSWFFLISLRLFTFNLFYFYSRIYFARFLLLNDFLSIFIFYLILGYFFRSSIYPHPLSLFLSLSAFALLYYISFGIFLSFHCDIYRTVPYPFAGSSSNSLIKSFTALKPASNVIVSGVYLFLASNLSLFAS